MAGPLIFVASDHAGFSLKQRLIKKRPDLRWQDLGPASADRVDYPDFADLVCIELERYLGPENGPETGPETGPENGPETGLPAAGKGAAKAAKVAGAPAIGVLICGSAQGMAMRANRYPAARAAVAFSEESARLARAHNDANILCLGERLIAPELADKMLDVFLKTEFEGGRHEIRVAKLSSPLKIR